ncbi:hypothetical protein [Aeromonas sp. QDB18]|uniref:hypothetical protein n=1 Tax=Aeromonas sp. QDB18 TaxID=2990486 RepID=UPI0022E63F26|nr:hypothetical protein [Aeromonas sp. QDB18]
MKNRSSNRDIPVHPHLLALGLLDYVRTLPADGRLFPLLQPSGTKQKYHVRLGVWWQRYLREKLKIERTDIQPFHSFRHTFINFMREAGVREDVQNSITGHSQSGERTATGRRYGTYTLSLKKSIVDAIPLVPIPADAG